MKKCKLYNPLLVEYDVYVKKASYTLIYFGSFLLLNKISKDT